MPRHRGGERGSFLDGFTPIWVPATASIDGREDTPFHTRVNILTIESGASDEAEQSLSDSIGLRPGVAFLHFEA